MNELHLFAGTGGGILAGMLLGHTTVCAVEIEPYCRKVLLQRQRDGILPRFPIWDDVRTFDGAPWRGKARIIAGGSPCKGISAARTNAPKSGRPGIDGGSSELFYEYIRITKEAQPEFCFWENTPTITTQGLEKVLKRFDALGYNTRRGVFECRSEGADHVRERMYLFAYSNSPQFKRRCVPSGVHKKYADFSRSSWWKNKARMERVENGTPNQMDRLKAIGNGQFPSVAALAFRTLSSGII